MDEKRKEEEARELTPDEIDEMIFKNRLQVESMMRKSPNTISPIPTRMQRSSLVPMMHPSAISHLTRMATS